MKRLSIIALLMLSCNPLGTALAADNKLVIKALAEKQVATLPAGPLVWRIETFATPAQAQAAAGEWSLVAQAADKVWLFTLGSAGGSTPGGQKIAEVGPIVRFDAPRYLLRINEATGAPGSTTPVHVHPGSEAFYVLAGEQVIHTKDGVMHLKAGQAEPGQAANAPMEVSVGGSTDVHALVMFVVDATKPFSSHASFQ
ncbi:MAG TPA: cupin domain-containing protein [Casimicrobiaceae bacterium]|nr:cupin domain-containing protein [Casimicrobiaceae bacterium]